MAPARALDGGDDEGGANGKTPNVVVVKSEAVFTNNCEEDTALHKTVLNAGDLMGRAGPSGDEAVDGVEFVKDEGGDRTECSSSFGNSCSESDDEMKSEMSGMEVNSPFVAHEDGDATNFDRLPGLLRKKKVTDQWRKTVGPIMWRCQWLELRMKDLLSQVSKYDKELALIKHEKDLQLEVIKADGSMSELAQLDCQGNERDSMKRIKRKRCEDTMDTSLYIKKHQILSYYYEQNKGTETDGLLVNNDFNSSVVENVKNSLHTDTLIEPTENDGVLEQISLREILLRIDGIKSRVLGLQDHLNKVHSKQEKLASSVDHTQVKVLPNSQKAQNRISSSKKVGNSSFQKKKDLHSLLQKKDGNLPLAAVPQNTTQPDVNEITVEMLFGAANLPSNGQIGDFCEDNTDDVLIDNQAANEEGYQQFEKVQEAAEKNAELVKKVAKTPPSKGENASALAMKQEPVLETPLVVTPVYSGKKRGRKPKKKCRGSASSSKDQSEKSPKTPPAKKQQTEKALSNLNIQKAVLVAVNSRRSQRVRKPKIY